MDSGLLESPGSLFVPRGTLFILNWLCGSTEVPRFFSSHLNHIFLFAQAFFQLAATLVSKASESPQWDAERPELDSGRLA